VMVAYIHSATTYKLYSVSLRLRGENLLDLLYWPLKFALNAQS